MIGIFILPLIWTSITACRKPIPKPKAENGDQSEHFSNWGITPGMASLPFARNRLSLSARNL
jgi:hypothetical protein